MQLRHEHVRVVARVADNRDSLCVSLKVCSIQAKQELRWIVALVQERIADWSIAVQAFKVELRTAGIAQVRRISMGSQNGPVSRYIMSHKLAEDRPTSGVPPTKRESRRSLRNRRDRLRDPSRAGIAHRPQTTGDRETSDHKLPRQWAHRLPL